VSNFLGGTAILLDKGVGRLDAAADGQDVVADIVDPEVGDRVGATLAATDQAAGNRCGGTEIASTRVTDGTRTCRRRRRS
jgi:hypothetical protein